jgi:hypothetical protein
VRNLAVAALLVASLALVAAGCGGKSEPKATPTGDWANSVCGALVTWTTTIKSLASSLKSNPTKAGVQDAVDQAESATKTLSSSLKGLGKPDTDAGQQAKDDISQLADELTADVDKIQSSVKDASGAAGVLGAISTASATLQTMGQQVGATFSELQKLDAKGELEQAFSNASSCKQLTGSA